MKYALSVFLLLLLAGSLVLAGPGPCGDINDDDNPDATLDDLSAFVDFFFISGGPLAYPEDADVDGCEGITLADLHRLIGHLFIGMEPLDCSASRRYSYLTSFADTLIVPRARCIPRDSDTVVLTLETHLHTAERYIVPFDPMAPESDGRFVLVSIDTVGELSTIPGSGERIWSGVGSQTLELTYARVAPGFGRIVVEALDVNSMYKVAVNTDPYGQNSDLYRPFVLHWWQYNYPVGDLDCDCDRGLGDLTLLINGLLVNFQWPPDCVCFD